MIKLTPLEQQLQQYAPEMFALHMLMKDEMDGGGGERHVFTLIQAIIQYNQTKGTGKIYINYSKGKISKIEASTELTKNTGLPKQYEELTSS